MTDAPKGGATRVRPDAVEDIAALRAELRSQRWDEGKVARADGPVLVEIEARLAAASAEIDKARTLAAELFQPEVRVGDRIHGLDGAIETTGKALKAARQIGVALGARHSAVLKA